MIRQLGPQSTVGMDMGNCPNYVAMTYPLPGQVSCKLESFSLAPDPLGQILAAWVLVSATSLMGFKCLYAGIFPSVTACHQEFGDWQDWGTRLGGTVTFLLVL